MTYRDYEALIRSLDLSVRSYNCLIRAYRGPFVDWETSPFLSESEKNVIRAFRDVTDYASLYSVVEKYGRNVKNLGRRSYEEVLAVLESCIKEQNTEVDKPMKFEDAKKHLESLKIAIRIDAKVTDKAKYLQAIDVGIQSIEKRITKESCNHCRYCHLLKEFNDGEWIEKSVCTLFPQTEKGYEAFAMVLHGDDVCEMFERVEE